MKEFQLKYGCNPNQKPAKIFMKEEGELPIKILNGNPGYINFMDAFNGWQLVKELKEAIGLPSATSFKHVSPTSAAVGSPLSNKLKKIYFYDDIDELNDSPIACAYARARGTDRMSSFGDWIALSDKCDKTTAKLIAREVSDGIIAPEYTKEALEILKSKRNGNYNIRTIDKNYIPSKKENRDIDLLENEILDSLAFIELITTLEEEFDIEIPDEKAEKIKTVGEAIDYIEQNANK